MGKRKNWESFSWAELLRRMVTPRGVLAIGGMGILWGLLGFNPWVGFGFLFAVGGMLGLFDDDGNWNGELTSKPAVRPAPPVAAPVEPAAPAPMPPAQPLHLKVIADAEPARARLSAAAAVAGGELGACLRRIEANATLIARGLEENPAKLSEVQRVFTYYLPSTADLISARGGMAAAGSDARVAEIDGMIGKLDTAFADQVARLNGQDARSVEIDLKLLERSLAEEFGVIDKARS